MSWFSLWKFLHIVCMFGAVAIFVGGGLVSRGVLSGADVRAIRAVGAAEKRLEPVAGPLFLLGIVFGFLAGIAGGFELTAPWLLISYGLVIGIGLVAGLHHAPQAKKLEAAIAASSDDAPSGELLALVGGSPDTRVITAVDGFFWVAVVFVMVVKPFGI